MAAFFTSGLAWVRADVRQGRQRLPFGQLGQGGDRLLLHFGVLIVESGPVQGGGGPLRGFFGQGLQGLRRVRPCPGDFEAVSMSASRAAGTGEAARAETASLRTSGERSSAISRRRTSTARGAVCSASASAASTRMASGEAGAAARSRKGRASPDD